MGETHAGVWVVVGDGGVEGHHTLVISVGVIRL